MPQLIQLQKIILHTVIFEVGCNNIRIRIIGRVLNRAEVRNIHILRYYNQSPRMLSGRPLNADKPCGKAVFFRMSRLDPPFFKILLHIAESRLFCEGAYGTGSKYVVGAKQYFRIFVCLCLVFSGEIQVNIRGFLISRTCP